MDSGLMLEQFEQFTTYSNARSGFGGRLHQNVAPVLKDSSGIPWFGVRPDGLESLQGGRFVSELTASDLGQSDWNVTALLEDRKQRLWIGSKLPMNFPADAFAATGCKHRLFACDLRYDNAVHRPCHARFVLGLLIWAPDPLESELPLLRYVVPASAGGASARPQALDSPMPCRLRAELHACQNEDYSPPVLV